MGYPGMGGPQMGGYGPQEQQRPPVKMSLVQKKNIKEANTKIEGFFKEMNKNWNNKQFPLTWEDPIEDVYVALKEGEKEDQLDSLGTSMANYVDYFKSTMRDMDADDKEAFQEKAFTGKISFRFAEKGEDDEEDPPQYEVEAGVLYLQVMLENWNSSTYYFSYVDRLRKIL
jgi:hypothetical protein